MSKSKRKLKRPPTTQMQQSQEAVPPGNEDADGDPAVVDAPKSLAQPSQLIKVKKPKGLNDKEAVELYVDIDQPHKYQRAAWRHFIRYPAVGILVLLNVAIVGSFLERLPLGKLMDPFQEIFFFVVALVMDAFWLVPLIFEVNKVETDSLGIRLSTLFWRTRLPWDKVIGFEQPRFLKFAILKTGRCFYLINKYQLKPFFELSGIITAKMPSPIEQKQS